MDIYGILWTQNVTKLSAGLIAQLVEHCTGIAEVVGLKPVQAWSFSGFNFTTAYM